MPQLDAGNRAVASQVVGGNRDVNFFKDLLGRKMFNIPSSCCNQRCSIIQVVSRNLDVLCIR